MDRAMFLGSRLLRLQPSLNVCAKRWWNERWRVSYLRDIYQRRILAGPEPERPRSAWLNWNYDKEIYAFEKRVKEQFSPDLLRRAFVHPSYLQEQLAKIEQLGVASTPSTNVSKQTDNTALIEDGRKFTNDYIHKYLSNAFPKLPVSAIKSISDHLMSVSKLAYVGAHIGVKDLILAADFPLQLETIGDTFLALVGALRASPNGEERASLFVRDFLLTQLVGADLNSLYRIDDPVRTLAELAQKQLGYTAIESRLIWQSAVNTVLSCYVVGIYATRGPQNGAKEEWTLIGESPGETVQIAEDEAARVALRHFYGTLESQLPLDFENSSSQSAGSTDTAAQSNKNAKRTDAKYAQ